MDRHELFRYCPKCGTPTAGVEPQKFQCGTCGLLYFFNPTVAVVVFLRRADGRALFIRRGREPAKGRLAPPGGFIDIGETAEVAAARELTEEVGVRFENLRFLCSGPNLYRYADVTYPVLDLSFTADAINPEAATAMDDVAGFEWLDPLTVDPAEMAFPTMVAALKLWQSQLATEP